MSVSDNLYIFTLTLTVNGALEISVETKRQAVVLSLLEGRVTEEKGGSCAASMRETQ